MHGQNINKQIKNIAELVTEFPCLLGFVTSCMKSLFFYIYQLFFLLAVEITQIGQKVLFT